MQDVVCRWDKDTFVLAFFDTNTLEAEIILKRINALLDCTIYDNGFSEGEPLSVSAQSVVSEIKPATYTQHSHLDALINTLMHDPDES